jgi:1,4-alpha-glucan branching enzyme
MVFLDVVYKHFGPEGSFLTHYAPHFFKEGTHTAWGHVIDFRRPQVGRFFTENALYWLDEFRFDGLRFDAVHAIAHPDWLDETAVRDSRPTGAPSFRPLGIGKQRQHRESYARRLFRRTMER